MLGTGVEVGLHIAVPAAAGLCSFLIGITAIRRRGAVANVYADLATPFGVNGAVNIRRKMTQSSPTRDMSNGWLAQPGVLLFNRESGRFTPREQGNCKS